MSVETFRAALIKNGLELSRKKTVILQINTGLLCNQLCRHCHLDAGPHRKETMGRETIEAVIAYARRAQFQVADVTGGAPELCAGIEYLLEGLSGAAPQVILRTNLSALNTGSGRRLANLCRDMKTVLTGSFPSTDSRQTEAQRGHSVFEESLAALKYLNGLGYGRPGSPLKLNLIANPAGAFLPGPQNGLEKQFRKELLSKWGIEFTNLFALANAPLGRFRQWLTASGNFDRYMARLAASFNPCAVENLMCRTLVSVSWDGFLHDCDFNLAAGIPMDGRPVHVSEMEGPPPEGTRIVVSDHCYACTAGAGFT
jgi:radical SAM/Cys-rich protein